MAEVSRTKKVLALSLGGTFNTIAFIVAGIIAARLLTKHDYATMKQTMLVYNSIAPLLMLGLSSVLFYFLPKEKIRKKKDCNCSEWSHFDYDSKSIVNKLNYFFLS